jgi:hypothetical protein
MSAVMFHRENAQDLAFCPVIDAKRETPRQRAANLVIDPSPPLGGVKNSSDCPVDRFKKLPAEAGYLSVVIFRRFDDLRFRLRMIN